MRITEFERDTIIDAVKSVDPAAKVWLFGSRVDDSKKGGDIDIAIFSAEIKSDIMKEIQIRNFICERIGEQQLDIVITKDGHEAIFRLAIAEGIQLL